MAQIDGTCDAKFDGMKDALSDLIDSGEDLGASVVVTIEGKPVVDIWGGWKDEAKTQPWERDTIVNVWSTTKTMTALCALMLIDRGLIHEDDPVAKHWPEFAANGKENVTVGHLMSHTSGLSAWAQPVQLEDIYDWEKSTSMLAAQAPWWEPGTASGYHLITYGHLIGEVVRRVTGKKLGRFFADEVAGPLGADFQIGTPESDWGRIATLIPPPPTPLPEGIDPEGVMMKSFTGPVATNALMALTPEWRLADIGGANGQSNARGVSRAQAVMTNGGELDGVRLLSQETIDRVFREYSNGPDLVLGVPLRFGLGYCLETSETDYLPSEGIAFWGGYGGSLIVHDMNRKTSICYMMNKMAPGLIGSPSSRAVCEAAYEALG